MDTRLSQPHLEPETPRETHPNFLTRVRSVMSSKIATTTLAVSAAVAGVFAYESPADAAQHAPHKHHYQKFPGGAKLEMIEGTELKKLQGAPGLGEKLSPLSAQDLPKIQQLCEFYDAWHIGIPLVKIAPKDLEKRVSAHFKVKDFVRIDPKDLYLAKPGFYQKEAEEYYRTVARIDPELIKILEQIQDQVQKDENKHHKKGTPKVHVKIHTNEGFRPYGENARTYWRDCHGNAKCTHEKSQHISGMALDIDRTYNSLQDAAYNVLEKRGVGGIGMHGANIVHVDSRRDTFAVWGYSGGGKIEGKKHGHKPSQTAKK